MSEPKVAMLSLWRNDAGRQLLERARRLTDKTYPRLRWIWVVGDSEDATGDILRDFAKQSGKDITILEHMTGQSRRLKCLSLSASLGYDAVRADDDLVFTHESDLISPPDVIERLLASGKMPVAATVWLRLNNTRPPIFYDIWAFRKDGRLFSNYPPYHDCYVASAPFEVDSFGSVWMCHAEDIRTGVRCDERACVEICEKLKARGRSLWVEPRVRCEQPRELWTPSHLEP